MIDIAGLLAAAALLATLVTLEVRHAGPNPGRHASPKLFGHTLNGKAVVGVVWLVFLLLLFPRVLGLLT
jgi:hypothetical protein